MTANKFILEENSMYEERFLLASERISSIHKDVWEEESPLPNESLTDYFRKVSYFLQQITELYRLVSTNELDKFTTMELHHLNRALYEDITGSNYEKSYANPDYALEKLGSELASYLCTLYTELRGNIAYAFEQRLMYLTISYELFIEIYNLLEDKYCEVSEIHSSLYYYFFDYTDVTAADRLRSQLVPEMSFATDIIMNADLSDPRYLYFFGEYISENEYQTAEYLNTLSEKEISDMASTFTEGFRKGFEAYKIDLSEKKTVSIRYTLGFERIVREAVKQFADMGLKTTIYRAGVSLVSRSPRGKIGFFGGTPNRQYDYDHRNDEAIIFDKGYAERKLSELKIAYESLKNEAAEYAGPAVMEVFGEKNYIPVEKKSAVSFNAKQQKQKVDYQASASLITNEYMPGDKISFTIIAYPIPEIGENFKEIFADTIKVNTLDSKMYEEIQTKIISALDSGDFVKVTGRNGNETDITIALTPIQNPEKETKFENCLADVNIPLGEVFTSPMLKGTNGLLHATDIYLNGLRYINLRLEFKDGIIEKYSCENFESEEENNKYIKDNLLFQHDTLPIGEFAIGTNTTAYKMGQKYNIQNLLPILIAEKTGPHFAIGDTCFSHEEDMKTYNPDGKEMKAKENDFSRLRDTDSKKAYFNCHTDITIPYNELGDIVVHCNSGSEILIIHEGKFSLEGTEALNEALADD